MKTIREKIIYGFVGAIVVQLILLVSILTAVVNNSTSELWGKTVPREITLIEQGITMLFDHINGDAVSIAEEISFLPLTEPIPNYKELSGMIPIDPEKTGGLELQLFHVFSARNKSQQDYVDVFYGAAQGGFTDAGSPAMPGGYDPTGRPWYTAAMATPDKVVLTPAYRSTSGDMVLSVVKAVPFQGGYAGVVGYDVSLKQLSDRISSFKIGRSGVIFLVQKDGVILANSADSAFNTQSIEKIENGALAAKAKLAEGIEVIRFNKGNYCRFSKTIPIGDWQLIALVSQAEIGELARKVVFWIVLVYLIIGSIFTGVAFFFARSVSKPIVAAAASLKDIAQGEGDLTHSLSTTVKGELGDLVDWFNRFLQTIRTLVGDVSRVSSSVETESSDLSVHARTLAENSVETAKKTSAVAAASEEMSTTARSVAVSMQDATDKLHIVAAATEEMTATISEISVRTASAHTISTEAVGRAKKSAEGVRSLQEAAQEIGKVVDTILNISEQTNLLALNATIEAASAGTAGLGFAVVAKEIKELSKFTAEATNSIRAQITAIQGSTVKTAHDIDAIADVINRVNETIAAIAAAVEEQSAATVEIAKSIDLTSQGINEVNHNIEEVSKTSLAIS